MTWVAWLFSGREAAWAQQEKVQGTGPGFFPQGGQALGPLLCSSCRPSGDPHAQQGPLCLSSTGDTTSLQRVPFVFLGRVPAALPGLFTTGLGPQQGSPFAAGRAASRVGEALPLWPIALSGVLPGGEAFTRAAWLQEALAAPTDSGGGGQTLGRELSRQ